MDDPVLFKMAGKLKSQVAFFSRTQPVENGAFVDGGKIVWQWSGARRAICDADQLLSLIQICCACRWTRRRGCMGRI